MSEHQVPPYRVAAGVTGAVLLGYLLTLAPTVTFWDAGELIAAARTLGIPHPPGTPLFVMIAHVWAMLLPVGEYAFRTNLLSALLSACGAGCFFLVAHESLRGLDSASARMGGAAAGAIAGAFTFTAWQNSNETEVYAVATFTIGAVSWLALRWRAARGTPKAAANPSPHRLSRRPVRRQSPARAAGGPRARDISRDDAPPQSSDRPRRAEARVGRSGGGSGRMGAAGGDGTRQYHADCGSGSGLRGRRRVRGLDGRGPGSPSRVCRSR